MDNNQREILYKIYSEATKTTDNYTISCNIGIRAEQREDICKFLEDEGYIKNCSFHGQTYIRCTVLPKTFELFTE